ncbi:hypothetical protein EIP86_001173 [Pleurotus ostreatoroseus]|nr:hypothetical protein EIP86_001173 [Pleurotus ostreatoroseus]
MRTNQQDIGPLILATHVCRSWRLIALDTAELWAQMHSFREDVFKAFVLRSREAPLKIHFTFNIYNEEAPPAKSIYTILMSQSHRIRDLTLHVDVSGYAFLQRLFAKGAPLLESLNLSFYVKSEELRTALVKARDTKTEEYHLDFPALRKLLLGVWAEKDASSLRGLMNPSLRVLEFNAPQAVQLSNAAWASMLMELPLLESLLLRNALLPARSQPTLGQPPTSVIHLPKLKHLQISDSLPTEQTSLLQQIIPSHDVRIVFDSWSALPSPVVFPISQFLRIVNEKFVSQRQNTSADYPIGLDLEVIEDMEYGIVRITLWTSLEESHYFGCPGYAAIDTKSAVFQLELQGFRYNMSRNALYQLICDMLSRTFSLPKLKAFRLRTSDTVPAACWDLFPQMIGLHALSIQPKYRHSDLIRILGISKTPVSSAGTAGPLNSIPFPTLQVIILQELYNDNINFELLCEVLRSRNDAGYPIRRIHICPSKLQTDLRSRLSQLQSSLGFQCID